MYPIGDSIPEHLRNYLAFSQRWTIELRDADKKPILIDWKKVKLSKFDFKDLSGYNDEQILDIIMADTWINLRETPKEWLKKLNDILFIAWQLYNDSVLRKIFERKWVKNVNFSWFSTIEELLSFIKKAWKEEWEWEAKLKCMILKCCSSVNDILNTPWVNNLDSKKERIVDKLKPILCLREVWDELVWTIWWKKFVLYWRPKEAISIEYKNLNDPNYSRVNEIKDPIWLTFEIVWWNEEDYLHLFWLIQNVIIALWWEVKDSKVKWVDLDKIDLSKFWQELSWIFDNIRRDKKEWTSDEYVDMKFTCIIDWLSIEIKIVPHKNKNQEWLNFQWIYAYLNKYIEWIMMRHLADWFVTNDDLAMFAELFFEELQPLLNKNPETTWMSKEEYLPWLWSDMQEKWFIRKWIKMWNRNTQENIRKFFIPWLVKYFESKLIEDKDKDWKTIWRNARTLEISRNDIKEAA